MSQYPPYVDGKPPVFSLSAYDEAPWANTTCVDERPGHYVVVDMEKPELVVARLDDESTPTLDRIFKSAKETYAQQQ